MTLLFSYFHDLGHFGKVQMKYNVLRIICTLCPDDFYEPEATASPSNLKGCHYKRRVVHPSEHFVLYKKGTPSSPDIYYCDYLNGYYSESYDMLCDFHAPCTCRNSEKCLSCRGQLMELLPGIYNDTNTPNVYNLGNPDNINHHV